MASSRAPDAFLSYTRFDDRHDNGAISRLHERLEGEIRVVTGERFEIFQDVDDIKVGERWSDKLDAMLDQVPFFIPILTPGYFNSRACRRELEKFLEAEAKTGRRDLILPIYYIECDVLEDDAARRRDRLATEIRGRQSWDWRDLRHLSTRNRKVRLKIEALAREIDAARRRAMPPAPAGNDGLQTGGREEADRTLSPIEAPEIITQPEEGPTRAEEARAPADAREPLTIFRDLEARWCPELVVIPAGRFLMGSPEDEAQRTDAEGPQHEVRIAEPFALGRFPVTFAEYDHFCAETGREQPADHGWGRDRRPVIDVTWQDGQDYCAWLGKMTGATYRLPNEAEWEYACRAGTTTPFWTGATIATDQANYDGNFTYGAGPKGEFREQTTPVDSFPPNPWGLHDMHGNVWEWCQDRWHGDYRGAPEDGSPWETGKDAGRVVRGGSWYVHPRDLRAAFRDWFEPGVRLDGLGLRVSRTLTP